MTTQRKLRIIKPSQKHATSVHGITIPPEIAEFFKGTYFNVMRNGTNILLVSGTQLSQISKQINTESDEINSLDLEDYKVD